MNMRDFLFWLAGYIEDRSSLEYDQLMEVKEQLYKVIKEENK